MSLNGCSQCLVTDYLNAVLLDDGESQHANANRCTHCSGHGRASMSWMNDLCSPFLDPRPCCSLRPPKHHSFDLDNNAITSYSTLMLNENNRGQVMQALQPQKEIYSLIVQDMFDAQGSLEWPSTGYPPGHEPTHKCSFLLRDSSSPGYLCKMLWPTPQQVLCWTSSSPKPFYHRFERVHHADFSTFFS